MAVTYAETCALQLNCRRTVYLLHKIYGAQIGAFVNNAVEVGEKLTELRDG